ncbi:hypothetical protein CSPX01_14555, partial [Colletotrichum filicis]
GTTSSGEAAGEKKPITRANTADCKRHSAKTLFSYVKVEIVFYSYPTT